MRACSAAAIKWAHRGAKPDFGVARAERLFFHTPADGSRPIRHHVAPCLRNNRACAKNLGARHTAMCTFLGRVTACVAAVAGLGISYQRAPAHASSTIASPTMPALRRTVFLCSQAAQRHRSGDALLGAFYGAQRHEGRRPAARWRRQIAKSLCWALGTPAGK